MSTESLQRAVVRAKAALFAGDDPDKVLTEFAVEIGGCSTCHEDALCFRCKLTEVLGEKVTLSLPLLLPKLGNMVKEWYHDRVQRKAAAAEAERRQKQWRPGPGKEPF